MSHRFFIIEVVKISPIAEEELKRMEEDEKWLEKCLMSIE